MSQEIGVDVAVVGAGPVGGTLALLLAEAGMRVAVLDRAPLPPMEHPDFDGRAYAIAAASQRVLRDAGLWDALPLRPGPIREIRVSDGRSGKPASPFFLHFDVLELNEGELDGGEAAFGWMVEARSLRMALNARLAAHPAVRVVAPATAVVERRADGARLTLGDGTTIAARLVVAAEGRGSPLREQAGIAVTRLAYRQHGVVCAIAHERPHEGVALEHFLPAGPFAQLPMAAGPEGENLSALVWTERPEVAKALTVCSAARLETEIMRRMGEHLGRVRAVGRRWSYPLSLLHAHRYHDTRLVLAGDAAHGMHPIAGQGLNVGFQDVAVLAEMLRGAADPGDPELLAAYQARRRPAVMAMLAATDMLDRLFSNDNRAVRLARDLGLAAVHRMPPLKRFFMRQAMGI
jgi:2-octaprenyl-6-methoxyphenol hydroxylase